MRNSVVCEAPFVDEAPLARNAMASVESVLCANESRQRQRAHLLMSTPAFADQGEPDPMNPGAGVLDLQVARAYFLADRGSRPERIRTMYDLATAAIERVMDER